MRRHWLLGFLCFLLLLTQGGDAARPADDEESLEDDEEEKALDDAPASSGAANASSGKAGKEVPASGENTSTSLDQAPDGFQTADDDEITSPALGNPAATGNATETDSPAQAPDGAPTIGDTEINSPAMDNATGFSDNGTDNLADNSTLILPSEDSAASNDTRGAPSELESREDWEKAKLLEAAESERKGEMELSLDGAPDADDVKTASDDSNASATGPAQTPRGAPDADDIGSASDDDSSPPATGPALDNPADSSDTETSGQAQTPSGAPAADDIETASDDDSSPPAAGDDDDSSNAPAGPGSPEGQAPSSKHTPPAVVVSTAEADVAEGSQDEAEDIPDGYEDAYTHLHVTPSTHRRTQNGQAGVTLSVAFALHPSANTLWLTLPPGYELLEHAGGTSAKNCPQVFSPQSKAEMSAYANLTEATEFVGNILSCQVVRTSADGDGEEQDNSGEGSAQNKTESEEGSAQHDIDDEDELSHRVRMEMKIAPDVPKISKKANDFEDNEWVEEKAMQWWFFHVQAKYPDRDPSPERNMFLLSWSSDTNEEWQGETEIHAWPILGDWGCRYSEWEGWGTCTARCGGGTQLLTRRVLSQPPSGKACTETVPERPEDYPCNQHPCFETCEIDDWAPWTACTASCGGGVKFRRQRFAGAKCPAQDDSFAQVVEECNTQPCKPRCKRSDTWVAITQCDALCGYGTFLAVRQVLQKDADDTMCMPTYERVNCIRQLCTKFTVSYPDVYDLPYPGEKFAIALTWEQVSAARSISIRAPFGYSFGNHEEPCDLVKATDSPTHSMMPHLLECKVDQEENVIKLTMDVDSPLPPSVAGFTDDEIGSDHARYELHVKVTNPHCTMEEWDADPIRSTLTCIPHSATSNPLVQNEDSNRWTIEIFQIGNNVGTEQASAQGYRLYWKPGLTDPAPEIQKPKLRLVEEADLPPELPENREEAVPEIKQKFESKKDEQGPQGPHVRHLCQTDWDCEDVAPSQGLNCDWDSVCRRVDRSME